MTVWNSNVVPTHTLHRLAQTDPALFRARLAAQTDDELLIQAKLYALFARTFCGVAVSVAETLEQFRLAADIHRATVPAPHPIMAAADACAESYVSV